jgi:VanZ like family
MKQLRNYAPAIGWGIFIFIISTIPGKDIPHFESPWDLIKLDKLVHMSIYAFLIWQILGGYRKIKEHNGIIHNALFYFKIGVILAICTSLYGLFIEWIQENYCDGRSFELYDELANTIGSFIGCFSFYVFHKIKGIKKA